MKRVPMRHAVSPRSSLPSLMMPCPVCAGRMAYHDTHALGGGIEDTVYACGGCGAEVIRTAMRNATKAEAA